MSCPPDRSWTLSAKIRPYRVTSVFEAHRRIFEALEAGDEATAREWMTKHFIDFRRGYGLAGLDLNAAVTATPPT